MEDCKPIYEVFLGEMTDEGLKNSIIAGHAVLDDSSEYYLLRLLMFPGCQYFLSKDKGSQDHYVVFTKLIQTPQGTRLQNPVGYGSLFDDFKNFLEIRFSLLDKSVFMCLFPKN